MHSEHRESFTTLVREETSTGPSEKNCPASAGLLLAAGALARASSSLSCKQRLQPRPPQPLLGLGDQDVSGFLAKEIADALDLGQLPPVAEDRRSLTAVASERSFFGMSV